MQPGGCPGEEAGGKPASARKSASITAGAQAPAGTRIMGEEQQIRTQIGLSRCTQEVAYWVDRKPRQRADKRVNYCWRSSAGRNADHGGRTANTDSDRAFPLHPGSGVLGEFPPILQVEFLLNLFAVILDGLDAQMEGAGNFLGFPPLTDELKDFQFPIAESFDRRLLDVRSSTDLLLEHLRGKRVAHVNVSTQNPANSRHDVLQGLRRS